MRIKEEDTAFYRRFIGLALPISMQLLIASAVNMLDVVMIGTLGDAPVAAVGAANQIFFLFTIFLFGVNSGAAVFLSQYWGAQDLRNLRRTMGIMLIFGLFIGVLFTTAAQLAPEWLIGFYAQEAQVIEMGASYLRIVSIGYMLTALCFILSNASRCTGNAKLPMRTSIISMCINGVGNAILIFGLFGAPELGARGAAISTVIARAIEFTLLASAVYRSRSPAAARPKELFALDRPFLRHYFKTSWPVLLNEVAWGTGVNLYLVAYGRLGTNALAAVQITSTVVQLFFVFIRGACSAGGIMIGNSVGAGLREQAIALSRRFLRIMPIVGLVLCVGLASISPFVLQLYRVSLETIRFAQALMLLEALMLNVRALTVFMVVGILRNGGDTLYSCVMDVCAVWLIGVPLAFLGVHLGFELWQVFLLVCTEEALKIIIGLRRVRSNRWVKNVARAAE